MVRKFAAVAESLLAPDEMGNHLAAMRRLLEVEPGFHEMEVTRRRNHADAQSIYQIHK